jgi:hypothetical protein
MNDSDWEQHLQKPVVKHEWLMMNENVQGLLEKFEAKGRAQHGRKRGRPARTDKGW